MARTAILVTSTWLAMAMLNGAPTFAGQQGDTPIGSVETVLRGIEYRPELMRAAQVLLTVRITASEAWRADQEDQLRERARTYKLPELPELLRSDLACLRLAYDEEHLFWQLALLNDSGWDWWNIGGPHAFMSSHEGQPRQREWYLAGAREGGRSYLVNGARQSCTVANYSPSLPSPKPVQEFTVRFVRGIPAYSLRIMRDQMRPRVLGSATRRGEECLVVGAVGEQPPPKGLRRLWVAPRQGFSILRSEHVELAADGTPRTCVVQSWSGMQEIAANVWLPTDVRVDFFGRFEGRADTMQWEWTKEIHLEDGAQVNTPFTPDPSSYLFPPTFDCWDASRKARLWDGGARYRQEMERRPTPEPDPLGEAVLAHAAELDTWMMCVPASADRE